MLKSQKESHKNISIDIAYRIAKKIAGNSLNENAQQYLSDNITKCLDLVENEPKLNITVHKSFEEAIKPEIEKLKNEKYPNCKIEIFGKAEMDILDCKIEWDKGGIVINNEEKQKEIDDIIDGL